MIDKLSKYLKRLIPRLYFRLPVLKKSTKILSVLPSSDICRHNYSEVFMSRRYKLSKRLSKTAALVLINLINHLKGINEIFSKLREKFTMNC